MDKSPRSYFTIKPKQGLSDSAPGFLGIFNEEHYISVAVSWKIVLCRFPASFVVVILAGNRVISNLQPGMFVGRQREMERLRALRQKQAASLIAITGRRRIGKSKLLEEFGKEFNQSYFFSGLAPSEGLGANDQKVEFANKLSHYFKWPAFKQEDWGELFRLLAEQVKAGAVLIVFDEVSWMASGDKLFLSQLKNAWDMEFKKNPRLVLALCGSVSSWITENILSSTGFVGRVSESLILRELSLKASAQFWGSRDVSSLDKLRMLSITGGVPRYLEEILPAESAEQNTLRLCFHESAFLFNEFDRLFSDLFDKRQAEYKTLLNYLAGGHLSREEVVKKGASQGGTLSGRLEDLVALGFARRDYTWELQGGSPSKLSKYRLSDNYSRFYLKYIEPHKMRIKGGSFPDRGLSFLPQWDSIMGLQFENLILNNRQRILELLGLDPRDVIADGPFFQTTTKNRAGCQIDYLVQTRYDDLFVCEIKNLSQPITRTIHQQVQKKLERLERTRNFSARPVLISAGEVAPEVYDARYFVKIIEGDQLL